MQEKSDLGAFKGGAMREPSELELLILPYLSGELNPKDVVRIEKTMADNPEFAGLVEEFRTTLSFFDIEELNEAETALDAVLFDMHKEIDDWQARKSKLRQFALDRLKAANGRFRLLPDPLRWTTSGLAAAALLALAILYGRPPAPVPFSPIALMDAPAEPAPPLTTESRHEQFIRVDMERRLDNARLIQYGRGDAATALSLYNDILQTSPDSWASRVAQIESAQILRSSATFVGPQTAEPLFVSTTQP